MLQRDTCVPVRPRGVANRKIKEASDQKATGPSYKAVSSQWSLKLRDSQHAYAEFRFIQTAFIYSSLALYPIRVNETRVTAY